jgi:hypothetical protein
MSHVESSGGIALHEYSFASSNLRPLARTARSRVCGFPIMFSCLLASSPMCQQAHLCARRLHSEFSDLHEELASSCLWYAVSLASKLDLTP